jgi:branched-chain amino acid aminotransferase
MADGASWTWVDGKWHEGDARTIGPNTHGFWMASNVFDGARWFEGVAPDLELHAARLNASAEAFGLAPLKSPEAIVQLALEGLKRFDGRTAIYIRPGYWAEDGDADAVPADPASTRFYLSLREQPMGQPKPYALTVSAFRRPTIETMPTNVKAGCLYPNNARAVREARARGFQNALVLDMLGNVAETATSNIFLVRDGRVLTPQANRTFLAGITRGRVISLLNSAGFPTVEATLSVADFLAADEVFMTGNFSKVLPVTRIDSREFPLGPVAAKARALYFEWARSQRLRS